MRALVLAAGLGTRLRPLTLYLPKPLLPVPAPGVVVAARATTVAGATIEALARAGCQAAALNIHHLAPQIVSGFGRQQFGMPLVYSHEPQILGTLGALHPLRRFLEGGGGDFFLLVNGDSLCDWPFAELIEHHRRTGADATLLTLAAPPDQRLGGGLGLGEDGRVVQLRQLPARGEVARRRDFAGCHVISCRLLEKVPEGEGDIVEGLYQKVLERGGRIETLEQNGPWHDLGDPGRYLAALGEGAISPLAEILQDAEISGSLVDREAKLGNGVKLDNCVVCHGARIGGHAHLERVILAPGARVVAGKHYSDGMLLPGEDQLRQWARSGSSP
jgi:NDP-sugar pyrophosphorylase family protein